MTVTYISPRARQTAVHSRPLRLPLLLSSVMLAVALAACGGSDIDRIAEAGTRTTEAGTARVAVTTIIDAGFGQPKQRTDATGVIDFDENLTQLEMRVGLPQLAGASTSADGVPMLVIGDGQSMYMRSTTAGPEAPWARVPVEAGEDGEESLEVAGDLGTQLRLLGGGITEIEDLGEKDVRGEPSTHYRVLIDLEQAIEAAPEDERATLQQLADRNAEGEFPMELWIGDGYVRRMSYSINVVDDGEGSTNGAAGQATVSTVIEYFDFGLQVDVRAPDNAVDLSELEEAALAEAEAALPESAEEAPDGGGDADASQDGDRPEDAEQAEGEAEEEGGS